MAAAAAGSALRCEDSKAELYTKLDEVQLYFYM
jgi:hypothetical protein